MFIWFDGTDPAIRFGFGYYVEVDNKVVSACSTALVCKKGVEICIITHPDYRKKGIATAVAAKFILHCLKSGLEPHYDAGKHYIVQLSRKLGYKYIETYPIFYLP